MRTTAWRGGVGPSCSKWMSEIDAEHWPNCGGSLKIIAAIPEQPVSEEILTRLGLAPEHCPSASPAFHCSCGLPPRAARISSAGDFRERATRSKDPQESELRRGDDHDGCVWAAMSTLSSTEADSKDHNKRGQLL